MCIFSDRAAATRGGHTANTTLSDDHTLTTFASSSSSYNSNYNNSISTSIPTSLADFAGRMKLISSSTILRHSNSTGTSSNIVMGCAIVITFITSKLQ